MKNQGTKRRFKLDIGKVAIIFVLALIIAGLSIVYVAFQHKLKINAVFNQVTKYVGNPDNTMFGEYNGQTVKIAHENRDVIWNSVTDKNIKFSTSDKMPAEEPIIIQFGDKLELDIYPMEDYDVFVKHISENKVKYYIIEGTCNFSHLKRMVSLEGWYVPNAGFSHLGGKLSD
jgi:hypothetical protein